MRTETPDERLARLEAKAAQQRRFRDLDRAAYASLHRPHPKAPAEPRAPRPRGLAAGTPTHCRICSVELIPNGTAPGPGQRRHDGRGLCANCYARARRQQVTA